MRNITLFSISTLFIACQEQTTSAVETTQFSPSTELDKSLQLVEKNIEFQMFTEYVSAKQKLSEYERQQVDESCTFGGVITGEIDRTDSIASWHFDIKDDQDVKLLDVRGSLAQYDVALISLSPESLFDFGVEQTYVELVDEETIEITYEKELLQVEIDATLDAFSKDISGEWYICQL